MTPTFFFDPECGFCRQWAQRGTRLFPQVAFKPITTQTADDYGFDRNRAALEAPFWIPDTPADEGPGSEQTSGSEPTGRVVYGGDSIRALLANGALPWKLLGVVGSLPLLRTVVDFVYRQVAGRRHQLPGGTPSCAIDLPDTAKS